MPSDVKPCGVGVIGTGPLSQFVLERLSLRPDFKAATFSPGDADGRKSGLWSDSVVHKSPQDLIDDPRTNLIYFAGPTTLDLAVSAIQAGKPIVLTSIPTLNARDLRYLADMAATDGRVAVIDEPRRWDEDFICARTVFDAGVLGRLERARLTIHERALPGEKFPRGVLRELGCHCLDQLLVFVTAEPRSVRCRTFADSIEGDEVGFLAAIDFADGTSAVIELQTRSLLSLRTGWLLEGTTGAYRAGRRYTRTTDGEIIDEPVLHSTAPNDPFFDTLAAAIAGDPAAISLLPDLRHAARVAALIQRLEATSSK